MKVVKKRDFPVGDIRRFLEPGPVVLVSSAHRGKTNITTMGWHMVMMDEPQATPETFGFSTSGWNAVPTAGNVIARIAPLLGIEPELTDDERKALAKQAEKEGRT